MGNRFARAAALTGLGMVTLGVLVSGQIPPRVEMSEVHPFMGEWTVRLHTDRGAVMSLVLEEMAEGVRGTLDAAFQAPAHTTDITTCGAGLVLQFDTDVQEYTIPLQITLTPTGRELTVTVEVDNQFVIAGHASKH